MAATGAPWGPFGILDAVGIRTAYNITLAAAEKNPDAKPLADAFKKMLDEGKLGIESGEGFYKYPDPEYKTKEFLQG